MSYHVAIAGCAACGHKWVELAGERDRCFLCESRRLKKPLFIGKVREAYARLSPHEKDFPGRHGLLGKLYFENAPLVLDRAHETFEKVSKIYESDDLSERVVRRLIFCFFAFEELGLHDAATSAGNMVALGYLRGGERVEVGTERDLADLGRALQWFALLDEPEWMATVNTRIGVQASHAVTPTVREQSRLLQIAHRHLDMARQYYTQENYPRLLEYVDRELEHVIQIQTGATVGRGYVEGAEIQAKAIREMGEAISDAIESAGHYIGLSLVQAGETIGGAIQAHGQTVALAIDQHGSRVERALGGVAGSLGQVAGSLGVGLGSLSQSVRLGLGQVSHTLVRLGDKTEQGLETLGSDVRGGIVQASQNIRQEMSSLGNKVALGMVGGGAIAGLLAGGGMRYLGETVGTSLGAASNTLAEATRYSGDVAADPRSVLIKEGFDAARRMLPGGSFSNPLSGSEA